MAMTSKIFILITVMNVFMFAIISFGGANDDGTIGNGYITSNGDIFGSGLLGNVTINNPTIDMNYNGSDENSIVADVERNLEQNSGFLYNAITFGWTMVKKIFKVMFTFITIPIQIFSVDYGFPPFISFILQLLIGVPITIAYLISLGMIIFGRATWD